MAGVRKKWNHPSHPHALTPVDAQQVYATYQAKWRCDICQRVFDGRRAPQLLSRDQPDPRHFHHCPICNFDVCSVCFRGRTHSFHFHRLKRGNAAVVYPFTEGQWRCDACQRVNSRYTELACFHCQTCEVDLCTTCFEGEWHHVLHSDEPSHRLRPVDPRLEYRTYQQWLCDNCGQVFSCDDDNTAFHCDKCNFDLCRPCFEGEKHHLHAHPLVLLEKKDTRDTSSYLTCSNCEAAISQKTYYRCRKPGCQYFLCTLCHSLPPKVHPYHRHPLHVCDPVVVYPQSGGSWHCDNCTSRSLSKEPTPLSYTEMMYHCSQCEYDLCHSCYVTGSIRPDSAAQEMLRPVQVADSASHYNGTPHYNGAPQYNGDSGLYGSYDSYRPYSETIHFDPTDTHQRRPLVTGIQSPLSYLPSLRAAHNIPAHKRCQKCWRSEATTTFIHNSVPHSGALCCRDCAVDIVSYRRPCPACRIPPDDILDLSRYR